MAEGYSGLDECCLHLTSPKYEVGNNWSNRELLFKIWANEERRDTSKRVFVLLDSKH